MIFFISRYPIRERNGGVVSYGPCQAGRGYSRLQFYESQFDGAFEEIRGKQESCKQRRHSGILSAIASQQETSFRDALIFFQMIYLTVIEGDKISNTKKYYNIIKHFCS